jgi:hypothetical protein
VGQRGGGLAVGDPDHPVQVPPGQILLDPLDDRGVGLVAGEGPAGRDARLVAVRLLLRGLGHFVGER